MVKHELGITAGEVSAPEPMHTREYGKEAAIRWLGGKLSGSPEAVKTFVDEVSADFESLRSRLATAESQLSDALRDAKLAEERDAAIISGLRQLLEESAAASPLPDTAPPAASPSESGVTLDALIEAFADSCYDVGFHHASQTNADTPEVAREVAHAALLDAVSRLQRERDEMKEALDEMATEFLSEAQRIALSKNLAARSTPTGESEKMIARTRNE
jgi:hypothetical protein